LSQALAVNALFIGQRAQQGCMVVDSQRLESDTVLQG
jgi:hypothetical protein